MKMLADRKSRTLSGLLLIAIALALQPTDFFGSLLHFFEIYSLPGALLRTGTATVGLSVSLGNLQLVPQAGGLRR